MIKEVFYLKKNSWHAKMIKFAYGFETKDFSHMCNYFWLAVLTIFIFPFILVWKLIKLIVVQIFAVFEFFSKHVGVPISNAMDNWLLKLDEAWAEKTLKRIESDKRLKEHIIRDYSKYHYDIKMLKDYKYGRILAKLNKISVADNINLELKQRINKLYRHVRSNHWDYEFKYINLPKPTTPCDTVSKPLINKQIINGIVKYTKPIVQALLYIAGLFIITGLAYVLYIHVLPCIIDLIQLLVDNIVLIGIVILCLLSVVISFKLVITLVIYVYHLVPKTFHFNLSWVKPFICNIIKPIIWLVRGIVTIIDILKAFKENNCPAISWVDDDDNKK